MSSIYSNVFSSEEIEYIRNLPEVLAAKANIGDLNSKVYFTIPLTEIIRITLQNRLGLDLSNINEIPMRWIKGDTGSHIDSGPQEFTNTYLIYLNDSVGEFIVGETSYPITANTGFVFNEGLMHRTQNTGTVPRLLLGPMNEFAQPVGGPPTGTIIYYTNYTDAFAGNGNTIAIQQITFILADSGNISGSIGSYTSWKVASAIGASAPTGTYTNGTNLYLSYPAITTYFVYPSDSYEIPFTATFVSVDTSTTAKVVNLPLSRERVGRVIEIKDRTGHSETNPITIQLVGFDTLENSSNSYKINTAFGSVSFVARDGQWIRSQVIEITDASIISTIQGLGSLGYLSSFNTIQPSLNSSIEGLGTLGYLSSFDALEPYVTYLITSSIEGLGTLGYISSLNSTIEGLGTLGYTSTTYVTDQISSFSTAIQSLFGNSFSGSTINLSSGQVTLSTLVFLDTLDNTPINLYVTSNLLYYGNNVIGGASVLTPQIFTF